MNLEHEHYWLTNLLLADAIARHGGLKRHAAVVRCAKRMRDETTSKRLYDLALLIIKATPDKVVGMVTGLLIEMKKDGLIRE